MYNHKGQQARYASWHRMSGNVWVRMVLLLILISPLTDVSFAVGERERLKPSAKARSAAESSISKSEFPNRTDFHSISLYSFHCTKLELASWPGCCQSKLATLSKVSKKDERKSYPDVKIFHRQCCQWRCKGDVCEWASLFRPTLNDCSLCRQQLINQIHIIHRSLATDDVYEEYWRQLFGCPSSGPCYISSHGTNHTKGSKCVCCTGGAEIKKMVSACIDGTSK